MGTDQFLRRPVHPMVVPWAPLPIVLPARPPSSNPVEKIFFLKIKFIIPLVTNI